MYGLEDEARPGRLSLGRFALADPPLEEKHLSGENQIRRDGGGLEVRSSPREPPRVNLPARTAETPRVKLRV